MRRRERLEVSIKGTATELRRAAASGTFDGRLLPRNQRYVLGTCSRTHEPSGTTVIFTRDVGHHACGWWKNPDYERCFHLSLSAAPGGEGTLGELDQATERAWLDAFFGKHLRLVWHEGPQSKLGRRVGVQHWRLFCDARWQPILPRGEVYTREFTEAGWRSASEVLALRAQPGGDMFAFDDLPGVRVWP